MQYIIEWMYAALIIHIYLHICEKHYIINSPWRLLHRNRSKNKRKELDLSVDDVANKLNKNIATKRIIELTCIPTFSDSKITATTNKSKKIVKML